MRHKLSDGSLTDAEVLEVQRYVPWPGGWRTLIRHRGKGTKNFRCRILRFVKGAGGGRSSFPFPASSVKTAFTLR
jgi:hypothetical protein